MNEEENKAIEILKGFKEGKQERDKLEINNRGGFKLGVLYLISIQNAIETLLNLIEKLQKEIEGTNEVNNYLSSRLEKVVNEYVEYRENCIPKDKIREKLNQEYEEYTNLMKAQQSVETKNIWTYQHNAIRGILEELLEEE